MLGVGLSNILWQQSSPQGLSVNLFNASAEVTAALPEEQHDGKRVARRPRECHPHLDGLPQALACDVEAVVVDPAALQDTLVGRGLMETRLLHDSTANHRHPEKVAAKAGTKRFGAAAATPRSLAGQGSERGSSSSSCIRRG